MSVEEFLRQIGAACDEMGYQVVRMDPSEIVVSPSGSAGVTITIRSNGYVPVDASQIRKWLARNPAIPA